MKFKTDKTTERLRNYKYEKSMNNLKNYFGSIKLLITEMFYVKGHSKQGLLRTHS